ncbi:MAG: hypothetical protein JWM21_881 [Acidobacteria bacterium]|nr:hypothetical protein [Acidobacteriota bacterium]
MRMGRLTRVLTLIPVAAGTIATSLFLVQGGFGGGHSRFDSAITTLGFPSIMLMNLVALPNSLSVPDILLVVWIPCLINVLIFFLIGVAITRLIPGKG